MFNFHNKILPIGLDIGTDSVKMIQVRQSGDKLTVTASGLCRFTDISDLESDQRCKRIGEAIRQLRKEKDFKGRAVCSAISGSKLGIKNIRLPKMAELDLHEAVLWEAKERFGYEVAPEQLGYLLAGEVRSGNEVCEEIIMLAVTTETVNEHLAILTAAGLRPMHIEPEPVALFRVYERMLRRQSDEHAVSVILDIGRHDTHVVIARGDQIVFIKNIDVGGDALNQAVAKKFNLGYSEAVELRRKAASPETCQNESRKDGSFIDHDSLEWSLQDAIRGELESLAKEISLCLRYCTVTFRGLRPTRVTLCGGETYYESVRKLLKDFLGMECTQVNPLSGMGISDVELAGDHRRMFGEWALAGGLALRLADCVETKKTEADHENHRLSA